VVAIKVLNRTVGDSAAAPERTAFGGAKKFSPRMDGHDIDGCHCQACATPSVSTRSAGPHRRLAGLDR
jgi:hypothetical protein